jgi:hypothetical protein
MSMIEKTDLTFFSKVAKKKWPAEKHWRCWRCDFWVKRKGNATMVMRKRHFLKSHIANIATWRCDSIEFLISGR